MAEAKSAPRQHDAGTLSAVDSPQVRALPDLVAARASRHPDQRLQHTVQMVVDAFYGIYQNGGAGIDVLALRLATVEAALWCARDRMLTLGHRVPPAFDRAVAAAVEIRTTSPLIKTLGDCGVDRARPLVGVIERSLPLLMLRPCFADGTHTALCRALPIPPGHPEYAPGPAKGSAPVRFCSRYRLVHQTLFGLLEPGVLLGAGRCHLIESDPAAGRYARIDCPSESACRKCTGCSASAAPGITQCRRHQMRNSADVAKCRRKRPRSASRSGQADTLTGPQTQTTASNSGASGRAVKKKSVASE